MIEPVTFEEFDRESLAALQARNLPRLTGANLFTANPSGDATAAAESMKSLDAYFASFTRDDGKCICCGWKLGGFVGSFTWGLVHGEGHCARCRYPVRAIHRVEGVVTLSMFPLPYHPSELSFDRAKETK